jgi:hypothetical protein
MQKAYRDLKSSCTLKSSSVWAKPSLFGEQLKMWGLDGSIEINEG